MSEDLEADLRLCNYDYFLPKDLIATAPIEPKDAAKLLVYERLKDKITHAKFGDLPSFLPKCSIIFNDTKVLKARLFASKENGENLKNSGAKNSENLKNSAEKDRKNSTAQDKKLEIFFHKMLDKHTFLAQIKGRVKAGQVLNLNEFKAQILALNSDGTRTLCLFSEGERLNEAQIYALLEQRGHVPLPPYIKRADTPSDTKDYQSVFARHLGAVAAPTASLHFSTEMIERLRREHTLHTLTLHIGAGTFKSVESEDISAHQMHSERFFISESLAKVIESSEPLLCVGTTTARVVEHYARCGALSGECDLFLHPLNKPLRVNHLLTNFHLPKSTLIMLVASFIGREKSLALYHEAILRHYRFYSYGDAMLII